MNINTSTCEKKSPRCQGSPDPVPGSSSDTGVGEEKKKANNISSHFIVSCLRFLNSAHPAPFNCAASGGPSLYSR